ncbi:hypothetical protein J437_LFUL014140 [Ladona fulva]|uniref:Alpha-ketoglutarate-dependent dioxygenase alkB homolog 4 n=1 Tax=Ladona fulva TaxID=123851 RepID=A0A8K0JZE1_LADFU|nr:hypothetical protein J437_LFUL014140 [Ladona fulva]
MGTPRPCGCKGVRTCLVCETEFGVHKRSFEFKEKYESYVYCPSCKKAWEGWDMSILSEHPNHNGKSIDYPGIYVEYEFISPEEENILIRDLDGIPWDLSQSGRKKQNYGPKCNFKKRKLKLGEFNGFPKFSEFVQRRFLRVPILEGFQTVEQCSLEYTPERGASIDPHIDDCWVWGERVVTVNVIGNSVLTLTRYKEGHERYNLADVQTYPRVLNEKGEVIWKPSSESIVVEDIRKGSNVHEDNSGSKALNSITPTSVASYTLNEVSHAENPVFCENIPVNVSEPYNFQEVDVDVSYPIVRVPMPARSLLVMYGSARYDWEHSVLRGDIDERRVCLAYREFTPPFLKGGQKEAIGKEVLQKALNFW